ncbi:MAG: hypothetical protein JKY99_08600 [Rhizobiales bacterium]|nr:hypothetical protein [Hyphomicrobiales bacterium]
MSDATRQLNLPSRIIGLVAGVILTVIGIAFGFLQDVSVQLIILYAIATMALFTWGWRYVLAQFILDAPTDGDGPSEMRQVWLQYRMALLGLALILILFLILSLSIENFFNVWNIISLIILLAIVI